MHQACCSLTHSQTCATMSTSLIVAAADSATDKLPGFAWELAVWLAAKSRATKPESLHVIGCSQAIALRPKRTFYRFRTLYHNMSVMNILIPSTFEPR
jgi:hypothetical protein